MSRKRIGCAVALLCCLLLAGCKDKDVSSLRLQGIELLKSGDYEGAIKKLDEAIEAGDGDVGRIQYDILLYRAEAEYMVGDYEAASHTYDILKQVNGKDPQYKELMEKVEAQSLVVQAADALDQDKLEEAEKLLAQAEENGLAADRSYQYNKAVLLEKKGQWKEAFEAFDEYCKKYPDDTEAARELKFLSTRVR